MMETQRKIWNSSISLLEYVEFVLAPASRWCEPHTPTPRYRNGLRARHNNCPSPLSTYHSIDDACWALDEALAPLPRQAQPECSCAGAASGHDHVHTIHHPA